MLLEVAAETQVAPVKHVGIDVAPNLAQVGHEADLAVEIGHRRNRQINADAWRARHFWKGRDADGGGHLETISGRRVFPHLLNRWRSSPFAARFSRAARTGRWHQGGVPDRL